MQRVQSILGEARLAATMTFLRIISALTTLLTRDFQARIDCFPGVSLVFFEICRLVKVDSVV
jgi:hypothetical protein